jgi:hypothetical protein
LPAPRNGTPEALEAARQCLAERGVSIGHEYQKEALHEAFDAAYAVGDVGAAERLIDEIQALSPAENTPMLEAHLVRARARLARFREQADEAYEEIARASALYRDVDAIFMRSVTLLDRARWHGTDGHESDATPLPEEAITIFDRLEASPWVSCCISLEDGARGVADTLNAGLLPLAEHCFRTEMGRGLPVYL